MKSPHRRFALLAASLLLVACASAPETKTTPRKKKHKKHDDDDVAEKHAKKKKSADDDSEKPDKPKKKTADASDDEETVSVADDDEESSAKAKKSKQKKEAEEAQERKQREKEEKAEREKQKAEEKAEEEKERKQREKEEKAAREKAKAEEEKQAKAEREKEAKAKKKKASEDVAEDNSDEKMAKKKKKNAEEAEEEPAEVDMTGESDEDGAETKTAAKGKKGKAAAKTAAKAKPAKGKKAKKKAEEEEPAETSDDTETAAAEEPEPETPVAEEKAKPSKGTKAKLAKAEKPAKAKGDKGKTDAADGDVIEMTGEENDESGTRVAAIPVPGVDAEHEEPELGAAKAATDEPAAAAPSMSAINDRPLTLGASKLEVHGGLRVNSIFFPATMGTLARTQRSEGLALGVGYGVTDTIEVGADYTVLVNPGTVKGPITFHGAYRAYVTPKLEIAAAAGFAVDFDQRLDQTTMKTSTLTYAALELGAWARYRLGRKASLFSGIPATPSSSAPITNLAFPLPPQPYQLAVGLNGGPSALDLPIGIGYQVSNSFYTLFMTDLAHIGIKNSPNAFLFKDIVPFGLGGFYVFEKIDFGLVLSDDLKKDTLRFDAVVRYPIK